ncbi:MAG: hypothetical protein U0L18_10010 [Acutalibacteraceae bacterium]|nr:hypothetical protein [Acutalibacteraceae bacterium]
MYISWKPLAVFWRIIISLTGTVALLFSFGILKADVQLGQIEYFHNIIAIFTIIYYYVLSFWQINNTKKEKTCLAPWLKGTITVSYAGIMIISFFFINHHTIPNWDTYFVANTLHYIIPAMVIIDWLLFDKKGFFKLFFPIIWTIPAILYGVYVYVSVLVLNRAVGLEKSFCYPIKDCGSYPYPFFNVDVNGIINTVATLLLLAVIFLVVGYLMYGIDIIPGKVGGFISSRKKGE